MPGTGTTSRGVISRANRQQWVSNSFSRQRVTNEHFFPRERTFVHFIRDFDLISFVGTRTLHDLQKSDVSTLLTDHDLQKSTFATRTFIMIHSTADEIVRRSLIYLNRGFGRSRFPSRRSQNDSTVNFIDRTYVVIRNPRRRRAMSSRTPGH